MAGIFPLTVKANGAFSLVVVSPKCQQKSVKFKANVFEIMYEIAGV